MGMFSYVYLSSVVRVHQVTVGGALQTIVSGLSVEDQVSLVRDLLHYLEGQGVTREMIMALGS
jgi:phosphatidate cytidylyltransferase